MLVTKVDNGLDKALKHFKRKFLMTGVVKELHEREQFIKPAMKRRNVVKKAIYVQKIKDKEEQF